MPIKTSLTYSQIGKNLEIFKTVNLQHKVYR